VVISIRDLANRYKFWKNADRIGADIPTTHWKLYFNSTMRNLCLKKFKFFGENSEFRPYAYAVTCSKISIGNNVTIRPGTFLLADPLGDGGEIIIEDKVLVGSSVHFYTNNHEFSDISKPIFDQGHQKSSKSKSIILRKGCWIGAGAIILPGVEIGENSIIGAGTIVTKSVPINSLVVGNPGRVIRNLSTT